MDEMTLPADGTGFVGPDVPADLLLATTRPFGHLPWTDSPTPSADRWLESSFPYWARSILEQWSEGRFDAIPQVLFSRTDDASQRLYYYVRELQRRGRLRGPEPLILDAALIRRESSLAHTVAAIRECAAALGVASDALAPAIARGNTLRGHLARIEAARVSHGPEHERLARAVLHTDATRWIDQTALPSAPGRVRVLLAGSVPPDDRLHRAAEAGGASVVAEHHVYSLSRLGPPVEAREGQELQALARHLVTTSIAPRSFIDRPQALLEATRSAAARGVILWQTREEEGLTWHVPSQRRALEAAGIPALVLASKDWRAADGTTEAIQQFCEELTR